MIRLGVSFKEPIEKALSKVRICRDFQKFVEQYNFLYSQPIYERKEKDVATLDNLRISITVKIKEGLVDTFLKKQREPHKSKRHPEFDRKDAISVINRFVRVFQETARKLLPEYAIVVGSREDVERDFEKFLYEKILPILICYYRKK